MKNSIIRKKSICKNGKSSILGADIRNIDAPGAEINKLCPILLKRFCIELLMKIHFESYKLKSIAWGIIAIIALGYLALMDIILINMFQVHITDEMTRLTGIVWVFFISGFILRLIKSRKIIFPFIVIGDGTLIFIMFFQRGFTLNSLLEVFLEPAFLLNILTIFILVLDWKIRFGRLNNKLKLKK